MLHLSSQKLDSTLKSNQCSVYVILEFIITNDQCSCACQVLWSLNFFTDFTRWHVLLTSCCVAHHSNCVWQNPSWLWVDHSDLVEWPCPHWEYLSAGMSASHHPEPTPLCHFPLLRPVSIVSGMMQPVPLEARQLFQLCNRFSIVFVIKLTKADYHLVMFSGIFWCYSPHHYFSVYILMLLRILIPFWKKAATDEEDVFSGTSWLVFTCSYSGLKANDGT